MDKRDRNEQPPSRRPAPRNDAEDLGMTRRVPTVRPAADKPSAPSGRRKAAKKATSTSIAVFYIVTVLVGVIACIVAFAFVFNAVRDGSQEPKPSGSTRPTPSIAATVTATPEVSMAPVPADATRSVSILLAVNPNNNTISVYDATNDKPYTFEVDGTVELKDKFGQNIVLGYLAVGDVVDITMEKETEKLLGIQISAQAWTQTDVTGVVVNAAARTVTIGNTTYSYDEHLLAAYKGEPFDITTLDPAHTLTICVYESRLLSVEVVRAFGFINIAKNDDILSGKVEIGTDSYNLADIKEPIKLPEGVHRVVVTGQNIDRFEKEIHVVATQTADVSLQDVKMKSGMVTIHVNEPDAIVKIDEAVKNVREPFLLAHGEYTIRVEKAGFEPYETKINFAEATKEISVTLRKIVQIKTFQIYTVPDGANVYVDNAHVGVSPVSVSVEHGQHTITVRKDGYTEVSIPVNVNADTANPEIVLQPVQPPEGTDETE